MKQIQDLALMRCYIDQYHLEELCSLDLMTAATLLRYEPKEMMGSAGLVEDDFLILVEGECIAYTLTNRDKLHCECYFQGLNFMGFSSVLWQEPTINDIQAITPCVCLSFSASRYREMLLNDVKFLRTATKWLADHVRKSSAHFEPLEVRLAGFLLEMQRDGLFHFKLTLCADLLETSYRHLLRTLHTFCNRGFLKKQSKGSYLIVEPEALENLQIRDPID